MIPCCLCSARAYRSLPTLPYQDNDGADNELSDTIDYGPAPNTSYYSGHTAEEVRQGHTGDHVRYILGLSIAGLVIVFAIAYFFFIN